MFEVNGLDVLMEGWVTVCMLLLLDFKGIRLVRASDVQWLLPEERQRG